MRPRWPKSAVPIAIFLLVCGLAFPAYAQRSFRSSGSNRSFGSSRTNGMSNSNPSAISSSKPFELLNQRNIFDPTRRPPTGPTIRSTPRPRPDTIALVGVFISNDKELAIFEGNVVGPQGTFTEGDSVGGLKILSVGTENVRLQDEGRLLDLPVGSALSRRPNEEWRLASGGGTVTEENEGVDSSTDGTSATAIAPPPAPAGMSDVVKKMMERRLKQSGQKETQP